MIIDYAGSLTECLTTDDPGGGLPLGFPDRSDGWFLKHLDTGDTYQRVMGEWKLMALGFSYAPPTKSGRPPWRR
jgi:hypothetical protein